MFSSAFMGVKAIGVRGHACGWKDNSNDRDGSKGSRKRLKNVVKSRGERLFVHSLGSQKNQKKTHNHHKHTYRYKHDE